MLDVVVFPALRGHRIAQRMLLEVEPIARGRGACKLTLEVLAGNRSAIHEREGFAAYSLDSQMGTARFFQKLLDYSTTPSVFDGFFEPVWGRQRVASCRCCRMNVSNSAGGSGVLK